MPAKHKPAYTLHKPTGQARVRIDGKDRYLGSYGSSESRERYDELITEWLVRQDVSGFTLTVDDLCLLYVKFADGYYRRKDGTPTGTIHNVRYALRYLVKDYGTTRVRDFGPMKLKSVRGVMIRDGHCRTDVNRYVDWIRRCFKWGVAEELVPATIYQALTAVNGLRAGRSDARESEPVQPVSDEAVEKTFMHLPDVVADMVRFQRLTGCRPGEVCIVRPCDVNRSKDVWRYIPERHKTEYHGKQRVIMIGPKAQAILMPYLLRDESAYCFSPDENERKRRKERHARRTTPLRYGNKPGSDRKPNPKRKAGCRYSKDSYNRAIARGCDTAFPAKAPLARQEGESVRKWHERLSEKQLAELKAWQKQHRWFPNQLRHTAATDIRKRYGLEAAQVALGHATADVTQVYAERDLTLAAQIMREVG